MSRPPPKRILVVDGVGRVVTALARSLSRQGLDVHWAYFRNRSAPDVPSRYLRSRTPLADFQREPEQFCKELLTLCESAEIDWCIPCTDAALTALAPLYEKLCLRMHVGSPPPAVVRTVLDKDATLAAARDCGIPAPREFELSTLTRLDELSFPIVAKPVSKRAAARAVRYFHSAEALRAALAEPNFASTSLFQEYVPGVGVGIEILMHAGHPVAVFQHRRLKELPYTGGISVVAQAEPADPQLTEQAVALLRQLRWEGVAMVEFRHDAASGRAALMEVNGRYWGSLPLSLLAGMDFPAMQYALLRGEMPGRPAYKAGVRMRSTSAAISRMLGIIAAWRAGHVAGGRLTAELLGFVRDFGPGTYDAIWSWRDPGPALAEYKLFFRAGARSVLAKLPAPWRLVWTAGRTEGAGVALSMANRLWARRQRPALSTLPASVRSVLFVCSGNIIRSPMSEFLFQRLLRQEGIQNIEVASAGLHAVAGRAADNRALRVAREFDIDLTPHQAQRLTPELIARYDLIVGMDLQNESLFWRKFPEARAKWRLLGDLGLNGTIIEDPYSGEESDIAAAYKLVEQALQALAISLGTTDVPGSFLDTAGTSGPR